MDFSGENSFLRHIDSLLERAYAFRGATYPNPPVGAVAFDKNGNSLVMGLHKKQGGAHAEVDAIEKLKSSGQLKSTQSLFVTLEPCNHTGFTPPCTDAIIASKIRQVIYGCKDPNLGVLGSGAQKLQNAGVEAISLEEWANQNKVDASLQLNKIQDLMRPFLHKCKTGKPWIISKRAWRFCSNSKKWAMIPPPGSKVFSNKSSLKYAHQLRRQAQVIVTGSGTILADAPHFTVRSLEDFPGKRRYLIVFDRRNRVSENYLNLAKSRGFDVLKISKLERLVAFLQQKNIYEVLVEAGPTLNDFFDKNKFVNEWVDVYVSGAGDRVEHTILRDSGSTV